jgi:hypothetical protein
VGLVIGDLLVRPKGRRKRWLFRPLGRGDFNHGRVKYQTFKAIFDALRKLELIEVAPGYHTFSGGRCTRLRSSGALWDLARRHGVNTEDARDQHFRWLLPAEPLVLRASSEHAKSFWRMTHHGKTLKLKPTEQTRRLEAEIRELNEFIAGHEITGGAFHGFLRIFNCGDMAGFAWNKGGRLYCRGESYQQLKPEERARMLIDGHPVVEIDIRSSFLTILHALRGQPLDLSRDPYDIPGLPRSLVKAWTTMTLGYDRFHTRWPAEIARDYSEEHNGEKLGKAYPVRMVREAVLSALPVLADWPEQDLTCFDLMYLESEAVSRTMLRLKRERRVVCLSVHDSIIVQAAQEAAAANTLKEEYRRVVGVEPALKVNRLDGSFEILSASAQVDGIDATWGTFKGDFAGEAGTWASAGG